MFLISGPSPEVSTVLLEHVLDSTKLDIFPGLPGVELPFGLSVHALMLLAAGGLGCGLALWAVRKSSLKPRGWALAFEVLVVFLRDDIVYPVLGRERAIWR